MKCGQLNRIWIRSCVKRNSKVNWTLYFMKKISDIISWTPLVKRTFYLLWGKFVLKHSNWHWFSAEYCWQSLTSLGFPHLSKIHSRNFMLYWSFNMSDNSFSIFVGFIFSTRLWSTNSLKRSKLTVSFPNIKYQIVIYCGIS